VTDAHAAIAAVFRIEFPRLVAGLARLTREVGRAEELAQDALVVALERWPTDGVPDNPGAWLMTTARRRALDGVRHARIVDAKHVQLARDRDADPRDVAGELADALDDDVGDDLLRLVFTACHPVLPTEARVALTLRLVGGLATSEIARAFLVPEPTIAQRILRAKRSLADARVPFEVPRAPERAERLESVLEVIYLVFNEGHVATAGASLTRPELCDDALRIARVLAGLAPDEPEVHGLVALLELSASRLAARIDGDGAPVLLADQDRARWDRVLVRRGLAALARADELLATQVPPPVRISCKPRSPHITRAPRPPRRRSGRGSPPSTRCSPSARRRPSSSSIARSRSRWHSAPTPASSSSTRSSSTARSPRITCCRRCAATCSRGSDATTRRARNFSARRS